MAKRILGLDLGTNSIGVALVEEATNEYEINKIIKLAVRVINYDNFSVIDRTSGRISASAPAATSENFAAGKSLSPNAERTKYRSARRNLQRFKLRRAHLIGILLNCGWISKTTALAESGNNSTYQTLALRAKAARQQISLAELARVLLAINKKRGYKSSRKIQNEEDGRLLDGMEVAIELHKQKLTVGQYVLAQLNTGAKYIPDFYRSDLAAEFTKIWQYQQTFYPEILTDELHQNLIGKNSKQTWAICAKPFNIKGIKLKENGQPLNKAQLQKKIYKLRVDALIEKLDLELLAIVLQDINKNINQSSGYLSAISDRSKELHFNNETVGEYLYKQIQSNRHISLKKQVFYRQDYLDEFEQIWQTQAKFYPEQLTDELKQKIRDVVIFYQRNLKSQKGLLSFCEFENIQQKYYDKEANKSKTRTIGRRVIAKSSPLFQEFKIWQNLNNLEFTNTINKDDKIIVKDLDEKIRQELFKYLNIAGRQKANNVLKLIAKHISIDKLSAWECNFKEVEGNSSNQLLFAAYKKIAEYEGYDLQKKSPAETYTELAKIFKSLGINTDILNFDANYLGKDFDKQPAYQLWHLLYATEEDNYVSAEDVGTFGKTAVNLKKALCQKFGFKPVHTNLMTSVVFQQDYGNLSSKAIRKIIPFLQPGLRYPEACAAAGYNHSGSVNKADNDNRELADRLTPIDKNSLRNPVVEKILNQMVNCVNQFIAEYGKPDEVRIELARELKKNAKQRADMSKSINEAKQRNEQCRAIISKEFGIPNPTKNDVLRYRLYEELKPRGYKTLFFDKYIPKEKLFSKDIDVEHIIPKALLFDDSFSNKTLAYRQINLQKSNRTAIDFMSNDFSSELENYKARVETLYSNGSISKAKRDKLLLSEQELPDDFIERDLRNSQYIAKKAMAMLLEVFNTVVATSGSITDKLREDWGLINVMKELNLPKYRALGLTENEQRLNKNTGELTSLEVIQDWSKRNDHRHHAMDALTVAFTTHNHIQYLNNLNARRNESHKKHKNIYAIENKITKKYKQADGSSKRKFIPPMDNFRTEAKNHIEAILVSIKNKNKVVTSNINTTKADNKTGNNKHLQLTPRGQLHKETVYGKIKRPMAKTKKLNWAFSYEQALLIIDKQQRELVLKHLELFNNNPKLAFSAKALKNSPIAYRGEALKEVYCYEEIFTIRKDVTPDLKLDKVVDVHIRQILKERLVQFKNDPKKAFSDLDKNPIWLNQAKGIAIKRVTITGVSNAQPLHTKKDHLGNEILDDSGNKIATDFVQTSNNHHVAIYRDKAGALQENIVSFYEAVQRANLGLPIIDKQFNQDEGWEFLFTMKQNEMFVFPNVDFDIHEIDLLNEQNYSLISKHLFRVQKISSKNYFFRHHLETNVETKKELNGIAYKSQLGLNGIVDIIKVRINHIGKIVHVGED